MIVRNGCTHSHSIIRRSIFGWESLDLGLGGGILMVWLHHARGLGSSKVSIHGVEDGSFKLGDTTATLAKDYRVVSFTNFTNLIVGIIKLRQISWCLLEVLISRYLLRIWLNLCIWMIIFLTILTVSSTEASSTWGSTKALRLVSCSSIGRAWIQAAHSATV